MNVLMVGLGGACGAVARYGLSLIAVKDNFPYMTFFINLAGAVLIGFFTGLIMTRPDVHPHWTLFVKVGVCGGFTTFSTFSLEVFDLFQHNHPAMAAFYAAASVVTCVFGVWIGQKIMVR